MPRGDAKRRERTRDDARASITGQPTESPGSSQLSGKARPPDSKDAPRNPKDATPVLKVAPLILKDAPLVLRSAPRILEDSPRILRDARRNSKDAQLHMKDAPRNLQDEPRFGALAKIVRDMRPEIATQSLRTDGGAESPRHAAGRGPLLSTRLVTSWHSHSSTAFSQSSSSPAESPLSSRPRNPSWPR